MPQPSKRSNYDAFEPLRTKQHIQEKLQDLCTASAAAWNEVKADVDCAWAKLQGATQQAADKFN